MGAAGVKCGCGWFLGNVGYVVRIQMLDPYLAEVRGDCKRCGDNVEASREGDGVWWYDWDAWEPGIRDVAERLMEQVFEVARARRMENMGTPGPVVTIPKMLGGKPVVAVDTGGLL